MVTRLLILAVMVAALGGAGFAFKENVFGVRDRARDEVTSVLDGLLGARKRGEKMQQAPKVAAAPVKKPAEKPELPTTAPKPYVDRAPAPSALERVKPEDQKRLEDLIAQKAAPAQKPVASRDVGAKRHAN